jgi:hypothetical protein
VKKRRWGRTDRQRAMDRIDRKVLAFLIVRDNGQCQKCGRRRPEVMTQTCHFRSRGRMSTRHHPANVFLGCPSLNLGWGPAEPAKFVEWFKARWPRRYATVEELSRSRLETTEANLAEVEREVERMTREAGSDPAKRSPLVPRVPSECEAAGGSLPELPMERWRGTL